MQIGWATPLFNANPVAGHGVGDDIHSWAYDGGRLQRWHAGGAPYSSLHWRTGDVVGCFLDVDSGTMHFSLNGRNLGVAFANIHEDQNIESGGQPVHFVPACSMEGGEQLEFNFGQEPFAFPPDEVFDAGVSEKYRALCLNVGGIDESKLYGKTSPAGVARTVRAHLAPDVGPLELHGGQLVVVAAVRTRSQEHGRSSHDPTPTESHSSSWECLVATVGGHVAALSSSVNGQATIPTWVGGECLESPCARLRGLPQEEDQTIFRPIGSTLLNFAVYGNAGGEESEGNEVHHISLDEIHSAAVELDHTIARVALRAALPSVIHRIFWGQSMSDANAVTSTSRFEEKGNEDDDEEEDTMLVESAGIVGSATKGDAASRQLGHLTQGRGLLQSSAKNIERVMNLIRLCGHRNGPRRARSIVAGMYGEGHSELPACNVPCDADMMPGSSSVSKSMSLWWSLGAMLRRSEDAPVLGEPARPESVLPSMFTHDASSATVLHDKQRPVMSEVISFLSLNARSSTTRESPHPYRQGSPLLQMKPALRQVATVLHSALRDGASYISTGRAHHAQNLFFQAAEMTLDLVGNMPREGNGHAARWHNELAKALQQATQSGGMKRTRHLQTAIERFLSHMVPPVHDVPHAVAPIDMGGSSADSDTLEGPGESTDSARGRSHAAMMNVAGGGQESKQALGDSDDEDSREPLSLIRVPGAAAILVSFDRECGITPLSGMMTFFRHDSIDRDASARLDWLQARDEFAPFIVAGDSLHYSFTPHSWAEGGDHLMAPREWGYRFRARALDWAAPTDDARLELPLGWPVLELACSIPMRTLPGDRMMLSVDEQATGTSVPSWNEDDSGLLLNALVSYVRSPDAPQKILALSLLTRLLHCSDRQLRIQLARDDALGGGSSSIAARAIEAMMPLFSWGGAAVGHSSSLNSYARARDSGNTSTTTTTTTTACLKRHSLDVLQSLQAELNGVWDAPRMTLSSRTATQGPAARRAPLYFDLHFQALLRASLSGESLNHSMATIARSLPSDRSGDAEEKKTSSSSSAKPQPHAAALEPMEESAGTNAGAGHGWGWGRHARLQPWQQEVHRALGVLAALVRDYDCVTLPSSSASSTSSEVCGTGLVSSAPGSIGVCDRHALAPVTLNWWLHEAAVQRSPLGVLIGAVQRFSRSLLPSLYLKFWSTDLRSYWNRLLLAAEHPITVAFLLARLQEVISMDARRFSCLDMIRGTTEAVTVAEVASQLSQLEARMDHNRAQHIEWSSVRLGWQQQLAALARSSASAGTSYCITEDFSHVAVSEQEVGEEGGARPVLSVSAAVAQVVEEVDGQAQSSSVQEAAREAGAMEQKEGGVDAEEKQAPPAPPTAGPSRHRRRRRSTKEKRQVSEASGACAERSGAKRRDCLYMDAVVGGVGQRWKERLRACVWNGATHVCVYVVCAYAYVAPLPAVCMGTNGCFLCYQRL